MAGKFALFEMSYGEDAYGEDLPVAALVRLDDALYARLSDAVVDIRTKNALGTDLVLPTEAVRWLKKIAYTTEGSLANVPGFFDSEKDDVHYCGESAGIEIDGDRVDFGDECVPYEDGYVERAALSVDAKALPSGVPFVGVCGEHDDYEIGCILESWALLKRAFPGAESDEIRTSEASHDLAQGAMRLAEKLRAVISSPDAKNLLPPADRDEVLISLDSAANSLRLALGQAKWQQKTTDAPPAHAARERG